MEEIRKKLQAELDRLGWTVPTASCKTGIPKPTIYAHLSGGRAVGIRSARKYIDAGLSPRVFFSQAA